MGISSANNQLTSLDVEAILNNVDGKQHNVSIGDPFLILDEGLTTIEAGERMYELQDNILGDRDEFLSFNEVGWDIINFVNVAFLGLDGHAGCDGPHVQGVGRRPSFGVCRSVRNHWGRGDTVNSQENNVWSKYVDMIGHTGEWGQDRGLNNPKKLWKVRIPIIAETGPDARPCLGTHGNSTEDPSPATSTQNSRYEIIGFITGYIYDSDIGEGKAKLPDVNNCENVGNYNIPKERVRYSTMIGSYTCSGPGSGAPVSETPAHPFGFSNPSDTTKGCNLVRARLDCKTSLFPSDEDRFNNDPYLVD